MSNRRTLVLYMALVGMAAAVLPLRSVVAQGTELLFVENTLSGDVTVIDVATLKVTGTIPIGRYPDDIIVSKRGDILYVSRMMSRSEDGAQPLPGEIVAINPATKTVTWRAPVSGEPHHLALSDDGEQLFVPIFSSNHVEVLNTRRRAVVDKIPVGYGPHGTFLSPNGKNVYSGTIHQQQITVFDAATHKPIKVIPMSEGVRPFAIAKDESRLYAQLSRLHGFVVVDLTTNKIIRTVELPDRDKVAMPGSWPYTVNHGLALSPDEKLLVAAATRSDFVAIYSLPELELLGSVPVGVEPNWLTFSVDARYLYASNRKSNDVSVIDMANRKEVARIKVGNYPQRMAAVVVK